jgi:hypothetical protein
MVNSIEINKINELIYIRMFVGAIILHYRVRVAGVIRPRTALGEKKSNKTEAVKAC